MKKIIISLCCGIISFIAVLIAAILIPTKLLNNYIYPDIDQNSGADGYESGEYVKIELVSDEHCLILSQNPVFVKQGQPATFRVMFEDNYTLSENDECEYTGGYIVVNDTDTNGKIKVVSKIQTRYYKFEYVTPDEENGYITCSTNEENVIEYDAITVEAKPASNKIFLGWSTGDTIVNGGKIVSYTPKYTFTVTSDVKLYPNFLEEGYAIIIYHLNGGVLASDNETETIITQFDTSVKGAPNLIGDVGTIKRDGYTLLEFTTKENGGGIAINPGGLAAIPENGALEVYAQWSKWSKDTDFSYTVSNGCATITHYSGNDEFLSIPAEIDGYAVTKIKARAISNKSFHTVVIPRTVTVMESSAFYNCKSLSTLYICDTFTSVPDDVFSSCGSIRNLRLNAGRAPTYVTIEENLATRLEYIMARDDAKPIILLVGGSSALFGFDSPRIEALLNNKYHVINAGTNGGSTGLLFIEGLSKFLREDDIIVHVPEYFATQMSEFVFYWRTLRATESCYNLYRYVDFSRYSGFFSSMSEFNTDPSARLNRRPIEYNIKNNSLTHPNCDVNKIRPYENKTFTNFPAINAEKFNESIIANLNTIIDLVKTNGVKFYYSCAPIYASNFPSTDADVYAYYNKAVNRLHCDVISNPLNYKFDYNEFYDSCYHLTSAAATERSEQLATDLLAQFSKEKQ